MRPPRSPADRHMGAGPVSTKMSKVNGPDPPPRVPVGDQSVERKQLRPPPTCCAAGSAAHPLAAPAPGPFAPAAEHPHLPPPAPLAGSAPRLELGPLRRTCRTVVVEPWRPDLMGSSEVGKVVELFMVALEGDHCRGDGASAVVCHDQVRLAGSGTRGSRQDGARHRDHDMCGRCNTPSRPDGTSSTTTSRVSPGTPQHRGRPEGRHRRPTRRSRPAPVRSRRGVWPTGSILHQTFGRPGAPTAAPVSRRR